MTAASQDSRLLSIGFLMDMTEKAAWKTGGGRGPWHAALAALVLAIDPNVKARRLIESLPAAAPMDETATLNALAHLGYYARRTAIDGSAIDERLLPCLLTRADGTPVVLFRDAQGVMIFDAAQNTITPHGGRVRGHIHSFTRYDRTLQPESTFMRGEERSWFRALLSRFASTFWQILWVSLALNIFALAPPLFVMLAYDRVISPADASALPALALGVTLALVFEYLLRDIRSEGLAWLTARMDNLVGAKIFAHLVGLPAALLEQASVSSQIARVKTFEAVRDFFSSGVFLSFLEIPFILIAAAAMAALAGPLVLVPLAIVCAYGGLFVIMRHKIRTTIRLAAKASSARQQFTIETFEKLRGIRQAGIDAAWLRKYEQLAARETVMNFRLNMLGGIAETSANALTIIAAVATIAFGVHMVWAGAMTTGALVACMIIVWRILLPFYSLCTMIPRLEQLRSSIQQINKLMDIETEEDTAPARAALPALKGHITLDHVTMRYDNGDAVFKNLTCDIPAGALAAVTGPSGSGKGTLLKLVKGLYRPASGMVRVDGYDIRQMDAQELRRQIAYVPQQPDFFPATLAENLSIGNPFATADDIRRALELADCRAEIDSWPQGTDTPVTAGQTIAPDLAARLSLARAYVQNANILLVDELPPSVMNATAGRRLREYISSGRGQRTVVIATHRGDLIAQADVTIQLAPAFEDAPAKVTAPAAPRTSARNKTEAA